MRIKLAWVYSRKARIGIVVVFVLLVSLLCVLFCSSCLTTPWSRLARTTECHLSTAEAGTLLLWLAVSVLLSTLCAFYLKASTDAYFIRDELLAVTNSFFGGLSFAFYFLQSQYAWKINPIRYLVLATYLVAFYMSFVRTLKPPGIRRIYVASSNLSSHDLDISELTMGECLEQTTAFEQLKVIAEKHLFVETILFLKSIREYQQNFEKTTVSQRYDQFRKIVSGYILSDSPLEVNLSSSSKNSIVQVNNETSFYGLNNEEQRKIFDRAFQEIEQLIWANLLR